MAHTVDSLLATWVSLVDNLFSQPFLDAGEGGGLEAWTQGMAQLARVSEAIEATAASLYFQPYSGQTSPSAMGGARARVWLEVSRTRAFQFPVYLDGWFAVEEQTVIATPDGGAPFLTGRQYGLLSGVCLFPGEPGPVRVEAQAERMGSGYNAPLAGTLCAVVQAAMDATGTDATIIPGDGVDQLYAANTPGGFIADHRGQYVQIITGSNAGKLRRVLGYSDPADVPVVHGGAVTLARDVLLNVSAVVGEFSVGSTVEWGLGKGRLLAFNGVQMLVQHIAGLLTTGAIASGVATANVDGIALDGMLTAVRNGSGLYPHGWVTGDVVTQAGSGAVGSYIGTDGDYVLIAPTSGTFDAIGELTGSVSGFTCFPDGIAYDSRLAGGVGVTWKVVDWETEYGLAVTNPAPPMGGAFAVLDELMHDRGIQRGDGETDAQLVQRGTVPADVVSPNAIRRAIARHYPAGGWELREVGTSELPGFFYDVPASAAPGYACAYDMTTGGSRFAPMFSYDEFRAFFLVGLPNLGTGEFGFAYDVGAWDDGFMDGSAVQEAALRRRLWADILGRKAGGVGFDFYLK